MNARRFAIALSIVFFVLLALCAPGTAAAAWGPWARIETLEGQLKTANGTNAALEQRVSDLQAANAQCGREKAEVSIALGRLETSLAAKVRWLGASQSEVLKLSGELAVAKAANDELLNRALKAERLLAGARNSIVALREGVAQVTTRAEAAEIRLGTVVTGALRLQLGFDGLRDVIGGLSGQIAELNDEAVRNSRSNLVGMLSLALMLAMSYNLLLLNHKRRFALATIQPAEKAALVSQLEGAHTALFDANRAHIESSFRLGQKLKVSEEKAAGLERELTALRALQVGGAQAMQNLSAERDAATARNAELYRQLDEASGRSEQLTRALTRAERRVDELTTLNAKSSELATASKTLIEELRGRLDAQTVAPATPKPPQRKKAGGSPKTTKGSKKEEATDNASTNGAGEAPAVEPDATDQPSNALLEHLPPPSAVPAIDPHILQAVDERPPSVIPTIEVEEDGAETDEIGVLEVVAEEDVSLTPAERFGVDRRPKKKETLH